MAKEQRIAGLRTLLTGGTDGRGGGGGPVVCLLHGYGANGEDLAGLARVLTVPREVRFVFPEAPISLAQLFGFPSFCWWHVDVGRFNAALRKPGGLELLFEEEPPGLAETREQLLAFLAALQSQLQVPLGQLVLGGFSQGAMLSTDVALHLPAGAGGLAGLCLMSGALVNQRSWRTLLATAPRCPRYQSHGTVDDILPFPVGQALDAFLQEAGFAAEGGLRRFYGRHEIPPGVVEEVGHFISKVLSGAPPTTS